MLRLALVLLALFAPPAAGAEALVDRALNAALAAFQTAKPHLGRELFGVDVAAYSDALALGRFRSGHWGGTVAVDLVSGDAKEAGCGRYAAFVRLPPRDGVIALVLCPEFSTPGADALRRLTILHEMVHVVAGPDECRAMAFAARIEHLALGRFTPVERYWRANGCAGTGFSLP